jgi:hypothetical protein
MISANLPTKNAWQHHSNIYSVTQRQPHIRSMKRNVTSHLKPRGKCIFLEQKGSQHEVMNVLIDKLIGSYNFVTQTIWKRRVFKRDVLQSVLLLWNNIASSSQLVLLLLIIHIFSLLLLLLLLLLFLLLLLLLLFFFFFFCYYFF